MITIVSTKGLCRVVGKIRYHNKKALWWYHGTLMVSDLKIYTISMVLNDYYTHVINVVLQRILIYNIDNRKYQFSVMFHLRISIVSEVSPKLLMRKLNRQKPVKLLTYSKK